ncbi:non-ribosomal peptide synthetase [Streptomyces sp. RKND-216]|uniref:non-ribosomal peptide synthetase n=1 Tax=Streptomyces sp. RKND-216 TaxID=2562581 RepID=UPI00109DE737|nr:amino acid adenylation domain-containing protein [Streptomyces sp. RKND-216]THA25971.1 non-ribosomal peptide synthetase [Streptomyces sp. RKND-216]
MTPENMTQTATSGEETLRTGPHQCDALADGTVLTTVVRPRAAVTAERLAEAVEALAETHEVLRTTLIGSGTDGPPLQRITPAGSDPCVSDEWSARLLPDDGRIEVTARARCLDHESLLLIAEALADRASGPPDGGMPGSTDGTGAGAHGESAPPQYADVAEWLHEVLSDPEAATARSGQLDDGAEFVEDDGLLDRLRALAPRRTPGTHDAPAGEPAARTILDDLPADGTESAEDIGDLLLTAWLVVLRRFCGTDAVAVRVRNSLRAVPELRSVPGPLSAWPALRQQLDGERVLADALDGVRAARAVQRDTAELITDLSRVAGPLAFSHATVTAGSPAEVLTATASPAGLHLHAVSYPDRTDITLGGVHAAQLGTDVAGRLLAAVAAVSRAIRRDPKTTVGRADLGEPAAAARTAVTPTAVAWQDRTLTDLVLATARDVPSAVAVRCGEQEWSYRDLVSRAEACAAQLVAACGPTRSQGVSSERVVAVRIADPFRRLTAQLAVLLAGRAYLVVDPADPDARVRDLLAEVGAQACVVADAEPELHHVGDWGEGVPVVAVDAPATAQGTPVDTGRCLPDDLAYLLFTSGSTGRPKPVAVTHRNVVNYLGWLADTGLVTASTVLPATAAPVFDASLKQLWGPLALGGTVRLPAPGQNPVEVLAAAVTDPTTTTLNTVPRLWHDTLAGIGTVAVQRETPLTLLLGGEALTPDLITRTGELLPGTRVWNLYGPSETTANASAAPQPTGSDPVDLGEPVGGTSLHVLDDALRPVPEGAVGELYVGGAGVARGYAGRGALTAERFLPDPFSPVPGARLYRTGDLVRLDASGRPHYLGRADDQVKVRGQRVEPAEIEGVLARHPQVTASVAAVRDDRLVAWIVPGERGAPDVDGLRDLCASTLPAFMVPSVFVPVERVPLTVNGKVDRAALPDPQAAHLRSRGEAILPPRTPLEDVVAEVWCSVLGLERVGVHDQFFTLGGDSIRAMHTVARMRELMGIEIPLREFLSATTVESQAQLLLRHDHDGSVSAFAEAYAALGDEDENTAPTVDDAVEERQS